MALTAIRTWLAGETVTAAMMNAQVRDYLSLLTGPPKFTGRPTGTGQSLASAAWTQLTFDTADLDTYSGWVSTANTKYTPQLAGYYEVHARVGFSSNATGYRGVAINTNGAVIAVTTPQSLTPAVSGTTHVETLTLPQLYFNGTTDFVGVLAVQSSGAALAVVPSYTAFSARWVSS